ncbi:MAG TPA: autoinducer 2 ABC transporter ATP-binding protein LsrA [Bacillales bacterium]|nr:autoinducer 2 ABC transporter ATP-binding protein LsrA [Bacillales bacterium]
MNSNEQNKLIDLWSMSKQFSGHSVLKGVELTLKKGEVFALVGGNGAGKSTLMKIITGLYRADAGEIRIKGKPVHFLNPADAHKHGVYLVPQEPLIFPNMTIEGNITIGLKEKKAVLRKKIRDILHQLGWNIDPQQSALTLSIAQQQLVEILRGLVREAEILILDEPTSTLTFAEIDSLFENVKRLTKDGIGVFYITHRLSEVFDLADSVAVLRDGVISLKGPVEDFTYETLLEGLMPISKNDDDPGPMESHNEPVKNKPFIKDEPVLSINNLTGGRFQNVSFDLYPGEILGLAGVVGAGRTELAEAIFGLNSWQSGTILLKGSDIRHDSVRGRMNKGLVYVPEDRHAHGIFSMASIRKNMSSTVLHRLKGLFLPVKREVELSQKYIGTLKVKATDQNQILSTLSGGNQQKVVLAKYLAAGPEVIILDEPTRGIDANARLDIYKMIEHFKNEGLAVLLISSDMEEIVQLSDRVLVMHEGTIARTIEKEEISMGTITSAAFGIK